MYIQPNSNIRILHNCPLDTTYEHTIFFNTLAEQTEYFMSLTKHNMTKQSYQRVKKNTMRVAVSAENLYDCNYLMFQNASFGSKWFYAYIESVEYINNITSEITYKIDVMQTWFFDYSMEMCYVEREHSATDVIGEHIEPEPVSLGEYVLNGGLHEINNYSEMMTIIAIVDTEGQAVSGKMYDNIYGSATLFAYSSKDDVNAKIAEYLQQPEAVLSVYMCPTALVPNSGEISGRGATSYTVTRYYTANDHSLDGYTPKNKKLYTYPYNFLFVGNSSGQSLTLRYEFFDGNPMYSIFGCITQPVAVALKPMNYKGAEIDHTESLELGGFPTCSWNNDSYKAWFAQNSVPMILGSANAGAHTGASMISAGEGSKNPLLSMGLTFVTGLISQISNVANQFYTSSIAADVSRGTLTNGGPNTSAGFQNFYDGKMSISSEYAKVIDDFFTMFGYTCGRVKVPNRNVRPHWTYTKTVGCVITGSVPCDDMKEICSLYDRGITFWKNANEIGNYALDNSV